MADDQGTTTDAPEDQTDTTDEAAKDSLGDAGQKALQAERREKRAAEKRANELAARLKQIEDRDKGESEKIAERLAEAERRAEQADQRALRLEVASEKGLTAVQAKRLVGATREELEADADELLETFKVNNKPKPDPAQGRGQGKPDKREQGLEQARKRGFLPAAAQQ